MQWPQENLRFFPSDKTGLFLPPPDQTTASSLASLGGQPVTPRDGKPRGGSVGEWTRTTNKYLDSSNEGLASPSKSSALFDSSEQLDSPTTKLPSEETNGPASPSSSRRLSFESNGAPYGQNRDEENGGHSSPLYGNNHHSNESLESPQLFDAKENPNNILDPQATAFAFSNMGFASSPLANGGLPSIKSAAIPNGQKGPKSSAKNIPLSAKHQDESKFNMYNSWNGTGNVGTPVFPSFSANPVGIDPLENLDMEMFEEDWSNPRGRKASVGSTNSPLPEQIFSADVGRHRASSLPGSLAKPFKGNRPNGWPDEGAHARHNKGYESATLYKTELCRSFTDTGICRYGIKCQFAHGAEELRGVYRHPKYKTEICKTFHTLGTCNYGKRCRFIHLTPEDDERDRIGFGPNHERITLPSSSLNAVWGTASATGGSSPKFGTTPMTVPSGTNSQGIPLGRQTQHGVLSNHPNSVNSATSSSGWPHNMSAPNEFYHGASHFGGMGQTGPAPRTSMNKANGNATRSMKIPHSPSLQRHELPMAFSPQSFDSKAHFDMKGSELDEKDPEELPSSFGRLSFFQSLSHNPELEKSAAPTPNEVQSNLDDQHND